MGNKSEQKSARSVLARIIVGARHAVARYNRRMSKLYSLCHAALTGTVLVLLMMVFTLFIPPFSGVADDGSLSGVLLGSGLGYRRQDLTFPTGAYFVRVYLHSAYLPEGVSTHRLIIRFAMWLDDQFTHDNMFDIRFLALVYTVLYLPAVYLTLRGIASRVKVASEATFLVIIGALILGDSAMVSYFNSLYPEAMWQICLVYCLGFSLALQHKEPGWTQTGLVGLLFTGCVLVLTESHCAAVGLVLTVFFARQIMMEDHTVQISLIASVSAAVILIVSVLGATAGTDRFSDASKLHAMTNGVLMRAEDPGKTLESFGIDPRFETLTDMSSYGDFPYALSGNPNIQRDFLSKYSIGSILLHYLKHPLAYFGLLEVSVQSAFHPLRSFVGNFESDSGWPERAVNGQLANYSSFKANSLPQTIGFLFILAIVYWGLFRKRRGLNPHQARFTFRERQIMLDTFLLLLLTGIAHLTAILAVSGTAEMERYQMLCGFCIDGMLLLFVAEILHRLKIFSAEE